MKHLLSYNESLRDKMTGKSRDEIMKGIINLSPDRMLIKSIDYNFFDGVKLSVDNGADIHTSNNYAIEISSTRGQYNIVKYLLDKGADIHVDNDAPLRMASKNGHIDTVKLLLDYGADIQDYGNSALHNAKRNGHTDVVELLKQHTKTHKSSRDEN